MKNVIVLLSLIISALAVQAQEVTCQFQSVKYYEGETLALVTCGAQTIEMAGENNSPCKAADALTRVLKGVRAHDSVVINFELRSRSGLGGMEEIYDVDSVTAGQNSIRAIGKCSSTHIQLFAH